MGTTFKPSNPPDTWAGLSHLLLNEILSDIDKGLHGQLYSNWRTAGERAAWRVILKHALNKTETQAKEIIATWVKNRVLVSVGYYDPVFRMKNNGLKVDPAKRPT